LCDRRRRFMASLPLRGVVGTEFSIEIVPFRASNGISG
jgi:hypothetical protein